MSLEVLIRDLCRYIGVTVTATVGQSNAPEDVDTTFGEVTLASVILKFRFCL